MVNVCSFVDCKNCVRKNGKSFYSIPAEIPRSDEKNKDIKSKTAKKNGWQCFAEKISRFVSQRLTMLGFAAIILYLVSKTWHIYSYIVLNN